MLGWKTIKADLRGGFQTSLQHRQLKQKLYDRIKNKHRNQKYIEITRLFEVSGVFSLIYLEGLLEHLYVHTENFQGENWTVSVHLLLGSLLIFSHDSHSSLAPILPLLLLIYQENESQKCWHFSQISSHMYICLLFWVTLPGSFACNFYSIFELHILSAPKL